MSLDKYSSLLDNIEFYSLLSVARTVHGPYQNGNHGRLIVRIVNDDGSTRTCSYPKFLMEEHLGRQLDPDLESIDHIDRDKHNNDLNNLRLVPRKQHSADDTRRVKLEKLNCTMCQRSFERSPRLLRDKSKKGARGIFCSRTCSGRFNRMRQLGLITELPPIQPHIESTYYRNIKKLEELSISLITKYAIRL